MLTPDQEKWLGHLSNDDEVKIIPFDPLADGKFEIIKDQIKKALGEDTQVEHRGATSLGISGQDEIDVYVPVLENKFEFFLAPLEKLFGQPRSLYPLERARFVTFVEGKHIDIFLINQELNDWTNLLKFEQYLKDNSESLEDYRKLKESGNGLSTREYYRRKIEFINGILVT